MCGRIIYNYKDFDAVDSYWPMEQNMPVFGFGRPARGKELDKFMHSVPAYFTIGFAPDGTFAEASKIINSVFRELSVTVGKLEVNSTGRE